MSSALSEIISLFRDLLNLEPREPMPDWWSDPSSILSGFTPVASILIATLALRISSTAVKNAAIEARAVFWRQMTELFNEVNSYNGDNGIPGPRVDARDAAKQSMKTFLQEAINNSEGRNTAIKLRASLWHQVNIAHLFFQHEKTAKDEMERVKKWFVEGVCQWAKDINDLSMELGLFENDNSEKGIFHTLITHLVNDGALLGEQFRTTWLKEAFEQYSSEIRAEDEATPPPVTSE